MRALRDMHMAYYLELWLLTMLLQSLLHNSASVGFLAACVPEDRKALAVYPVLLFYLCIGWMIKII